MRSSVEFHSRPSVATYMLRSLTPSPGLKKEEGFPPIRAIWRKHRVDRRRHAEFLRLSGLRADRSLPMLYPHVFAFPLQMVILMHPAYPIRPWNGLQIRNRILQHRPIPEDAALDMETCVACQRILEKGAEIDLHTTVRLRDELMWESINTHYYRGRFGDAEAVSPMARGPEVEGVVVDRPDENGKEKTCPLVS